ncbi:MAG: S41 family peptidase [Gemmatimonadaceae bacterium]|nr:S41 family peptidase [Gemmatimonadaceae bacterium]MCW5827348.1 S41 family peptidase [Gemmatimonadaceae bacterium]
MNRFRVLPPMALIAAALVAGAWLLGRALDREARRSQEGAALLDVVMQRVRDSYVEPVDDEKLWQGAIAGMLDQLGDPNSAYLTPERYERLRLSASNAYRGVGLQVDVLDGWITVAQPRPGSPGERAGLQTGDRLVELDGKSMRGWTVTEARNALRGPLGSTVALVVERGQGTRIPVTLERADIRVRAVTRSVLLDGGVGYVAVTTFSDSTEAELISTVDSLRAAGARSLVIDMRGNPGGLLEQGIGVADLFLPPGRQIVTTRGRIADANRVYVDSTAERWAGMPIAVLVNGFTASAAEIVAGALQDHDRAVLLGRVTYGKGSAQAVYELSNGAAISLTQSRWFTPLGRNLEMAPEDEVRLADADTARPVFRTASGRRVYGGGGIVPDIIAGDSLPDLGERRLLAELGADVPRWREALTMEARALVQAGLVRDSTFTVRPEWRARVLARARAMGLRVSAGAFEGATAFVNRNFGNEIARQGWGVPYAQRRQVREDAVVVRAAELLRKSRAPMDVFATE